MGGPLVPGRAFYFGSVEHTMIDTKNIVMSGVLHTFRPDAPTHLPFGQHTPQVLGRSDVTLGRSSTVALRYRLQQVTFDNAIGGADIGKGAPERAFNACSGIRISPCRTIWSPDLPA
jgi:hypothetical protein